MHVSLKKPFFGSTYVITSKPLFFVSKLVTLLQNPSTSLDQKARIHQPLEIWAWYRYSSAHQEPNLSQQTSDNFLTKKKHLITWTKKISDLATKKHRTSFYLQLVMSNSYFNHDKKLHILINIYDIRTQRFQGVNLRSYVWKNIY